jgi:hypothetical protein
MSKNAMAGAVTLCGVGLCMIGGAMMMQNGAQAHANTVVGTFPAAAAVASAATSQTGGEPTIVWYGTYGGYYGTIAGAIFRAWSDGTLEMKKISYFSPNTGDACNGAAGAPCSSPWLVISSPAAGYRAAADINADEKVDGADLTMILGNWGDAPRGPFPPSDCPLNLINP